MRRVETAVVISALLGIAACATGGAKFPWASRGGHVPAIHADVQTLNDGYDRTRSSVLVRRLARPTRAALDYAAYHANFMIADAPPEGQAPPSSGADASHPFHDWIEKATLTADIKSTPLTESERAHPLAFAPMAEFLQAKKAAGAGELGELGASVRDESWGLPHSPGSATQTISDVYLHEGASPVEIWAKIEFAPWFKGFGDLPDQDGDGFGEIYGRVKPGVMTPTALDLLKSEYIGRLLSSAEVKAWANQLSSYWYPSFNTDLVAAGPVWPDEHTEADIKRELGNRVFDAPTIVLRGKPEGKPTYDVFVVAGTEAGPSAGAGAGATAFKLGRSKPSPHPDAVVAAIRRELEERGGGSWSKWASQSAPLRAAISRRLQAAAPKLNAFAGSDGFLFYRHGLEFLTAGDLEQQRKGKNPLPVIVQFKRELEAHDVDFLFVPVPAKEEIFPDAVDPAGKELVGRVVNPYSRRFLLDLAQAGVEVVDLLPAFLSARASGEAPGQEPLYQHQDTHWTDRGLRLAADIIGERIKQYSWFKDLSSHARPFTVRETTFTRYGDLQSRLPDSQKAAYQPETLVAHQVISADGAPYEDDPESPVVVLGDSFTGVYELMEPEHAGISAHLAKGMSIPVDLVMSYGGGPNVRQKLIRRGASALSTKKLVIWIMTARDLYDYWEAWEPLTVQ
jgi:alginate O-acetyltransferase complex protein AlgJ